MNDESDNTVDSNEWFKQCRKTGTPCIIIRSRKKRSTIEWNYLTLREELDGLVSSKEKELVTGFRVLAEMHGDTKSELRTGARMVQFENIPNAQAGDLAEALFEFVSLTLSLAH